MAKVTVIVPNYNHAKFLQQRIESILNQTFRDFELIILDDGSTDESKTIIEDYRGHAKVSQIIYNSVNSGSPFSQWKKGIEKAEGEYLWIAESDDWAEAGYLLEMVSLVQAKQNIGIGFCASNWVDEKGNLGEDLSIYKAGFYRSGSVEIKESLVRFNTIQNASAVLMSTRLAKKYVPAIEKFKSCGDWFLYINILQESDIVFCEKKLNNFRWYHNNISNNASKNGLWVVEGLRVLASGAAFKMDFSLRELKGLFRYWRLKVSNTLVPGKERLYFLFFRMMLVFVSKNMAYKVFKF